jgi:hypothetical protein
MKGISKRLPHVTWQFIVLLLGMGFCFAQTCYTSADMDEPTRSSLENAAKHYFAMLAHGDSVSLKQNAIPSLANQFSEIENVIKENQSSLSAASAVPRPAFLLKLDSNASQSRAEFLCGVFGPKGQTANSTEFILPKLSPGDYGIVILDANGASGARTVSFVLERQASDWKVGGLYVKDPKIKGHDGHWFLAQASGFKAKAENRDAWFYYMEARDMLAPVPFMYTQETDRIYDEAQKVKPTDLPVEGTTVDLPAGGKNYRLTSVFPLAVGQDLDLVVKYQSVDVSDTSKAFQENMAVIRALVAKFSELRQAFDGIVARAVEPSGRDYGSLLPMRDIK